MPVPGYLGRPLLYVALALKVMACPNTDTELKQNMFKRSLKVPRSPPRGSQFNSPATREKGLANQGAGKRFEKVSWNVYNLVLTSCKRVTTPELV